MKQAIWIFSILYFFSGPLRADAASLLFSRLLGGGAVPNYSYESVNGVAVDNLGNLYITGQTGSADFGSNDPVSKRVFGDPTSRQLSFFMKIDPAGDTIFSTILTGSTPHGIAVDSSGQTYIVGEANFTMPATNAIQPELRGRGDAFVAKLNSDGTLAFATFFGGNSEDAALGVALDSQGNILVTGYTFSPDLLVTPNAAQTNLAGQQNAFFLKLSSDGQTKLVASYLGGNERELGSKIAVSKTDEVYIAGRTRSDAFGAGTFRHIGPGGLADAMLAKINPASGETIFVDAIGGSLADGAGGLAIDNAGNVYLAGDTSSEDFPTTAGAPQRAYAGGGDNFVFKINSNGDPAGEWHSTFLGGDGREESSTDPSEIPFESNGLAVREDGLVVLSGMTSSTTWKTTPPPEMTFWAFTPYATYAYVAKLDGNLGTVQTAVLILGNNYIQGTSLGLAGNETVVLGGGTGLAYVPPFFPTTGSSSGREYRGDAMDAFVSRISLGPNAAAPENDSVAGAKDVTGYRFAEAADNTLATAEATELSHAGQAASHSLWWRFTAPSDGTLAISTLGATFDTVLSLYSADLQALAENDNTPTGDSTTSYVKVRDVKAGQKLLVAVDGKNGAAGQITLSFTFASAPNDDFITAIDIPDYPDTATGSNRHASHELKERYDHDNSNNSVWWKWTAPKSEGVSVRVTMTNENIALRPLIRVYSGTNLDDLQVKAAFYDGVNFFADSGVTYYLAVDGWYGSVGDIKLTIEKGVPPANDNFEAALPLEGFSAQTTGTNINATIQAGEETLFRFPDAGGYTVWWKWTAPTNGWVRINTEGSSLDTKLYFFAGSGLSSLTLVASNDNFYPRPDYTSHLYTKVEKDTLYYIRVDSVTYDPPGEFNLNLTLTQPPEIVAGSQRFTVDGRYQFDFKGIAGRQYHLQASTNLLNWDVISGGAYPGEQLTVSAPQSTADHQFYRLVQVGE
jgi:hypothetical protein